MDRQVTQGRGISGSPPWPGGQEARLDCVAQTGPEAAPHAPESTRGAGDSGERVRAGALCVGGVLCARRCVEGGRLRAPCSPVTLHSIGIIPNSQTGTEAIGARPCPRPMCSCHPPLRWPRRPPSSRDWSPLPPPPALPLMLEEGDLGAASPRISQMPVFLLWSVH